MEHTRIPQHVYAGFAQGMQIMGDEDIAHELQTIVEFYGTEYAEQVYQNINGTLVEFSQAKKPKVEMCACILDLAYSVCPN